MKKKKNKFVKVSTIDIFQSIRKPMPPPSKPFKATKYKRIKRNFEME